MSVKAAINGFGRIGRNVLRAAHDHNADIEWVAVNDLGDTKTLAHLLKYDSTFGRFPAEVSAGDGSIQVGDSTIKFISERDPADLPWSDLDVDVVVESTGLFTKREDAEKHLKAGASKVIISAPAKDPDVTLVLGVNDDEYDSEKHNIISNASCTTNCLGPIVKILHDEIGIKHGIMTTIHAYTADQRLQDLPHKDLRRARAAALSLIPTSTGAAKAIGLVMPEMQGKLNGFAIRAPVIDGSVVDLVCEVEKSTSVEEINALFKEKADTGSLEGILEYVEDPIVSVDVIGSSYSSLFDSELTMVNDDTQVKLVSWYDNEFGYSSRVVDLIQRV